MNLIQLCSSTDIASPFLISEVKFNNLQSKTNAPLPQAAYTVLMLYPFISTGLSDFDEYNSVASAALLTLSFPLALLIPSSLFSSTIKLLFFLRGDSDEDTNNNPLTPLPPLPLLIILNYILSISNITHSVLMGFWGFGSNGDRHYY
jgi:hypothetical protein